MSYTAITIALIGFIYLLIRIGDSLEFHYRGLNAAKHLVALVSMWLLLPLISISIKISEAEGYGLINTLSGVYRAAMWVMVFITGIYLLGLLWLGFVSMGGGGGRK